MASGWIKLYRQIQECCIWKANEPFDKRSAWIDLLLSANHIDNKTVFNGKVIIVKRGQFLTSIRSLSEKWKWSVNKTYRYIKLLENEKMLQRESDKDRTLITIENYGLYQGRENTNEYTDENSSGNSDEYTDKTQTEYKQKYKNNKENKNERIEDNTPPISPSYNRVETNKPKRESYKQLFDRILPQYEISEYLLTAVRKWLKYKYYEHHFEYGNDSLNDLLEQVSKKSMEYGDETVCTAISESIANGYQGIVWNKIKTEKTTGYQNKTAEMLEQHYAMAEEWVRKMEEKENDV